MRCIRRPIALLSMILFQLMLAVGAYGCAPKGAGQSDAGMMAGMNMPSGTEMPPASSGSGSRELPCQSPLATNSCQSMAPCTVAMVIIPSTADALVAALPHGEIATLELLVPASVSAAPELPPPRA